MNVLWKKLVARDILLCVHAHVLFAGVVHFPSFGTTQVLAGAVPAGCTQGTPGPHSQARSTLGEALKVWGVLCSPLFYIISVRIRTPFALYFFSCATSVVWFSCQLLPCYYLVVALFQFSASIFTIPSVIDCQQPNLPLRPLSHKMHSVKQIKNQ